MRTAVLILAGLLCAGALVACGGGGTPPGAPPPGPMEPPVEPMEPPDEPPEPMEPMEPPDAAGPGPVPGDGDAFSGESKIEGKLSAGALEGTVLVSDPSFCGLVDCPFEPADHYKLVVKQLTDVGVPAENIRGTYATTYRFIPADPPDAYWYNQLFTNDEFAPVRQGLKVVVMPHGRPFSQPGDAAAIGQHNVLFVGAAGNRSLIAPPGAWDATRDLYVPDNPVWASNDETWAPGEGRPSHPFDGHSSYEEVLAALATGKAIVAVWADVDADGNIIPDIHSVRCGSARNGCFAVVVPPERRGSGSLGTSLAAPRIGAAAYYVFQLWDRAEDVVDVLAECAIDVGAPGVDSEFGRGLVNLDCPTVAAREVRATTASVRTAMRSPLLDMAAPAPAGREPIALALRGVGDGAELTLSGFFAPGLSRSERYVAVGMTVPLGNVEAQGVYGLGTAPLGVSSTLVPATRSAFFEVGLNKGVLRFGDHAVSLVGLYGETADVMDSAATRLGIRHEWRGARSAFSMYVGALRAEGEVGVPGHTEVDRGRVSVRDSSAELRARYRVRL